MQTTTDELLDLTCPPQVAPVNRVPLSTRPSTLFALVGAAFVIVTCSGLLGGWSADVFGLMGPATIAAFVIGISSNRPRRPWAWIICGAAIVLWVIGGVARQSLHTLGNLTPHRSLVPDLIVLPGYVVLAVGLTMLTSAGANRRPDPDVMLDGMIAALATMALGWVYLIDPALWHTRAPLSTRVILGCYPTLSVFLVAITARIGFVTSGRRLPYERYLLTAVSCLLVGDVVYTLVDSRLLSYQGPLINLPYGLAFAGAGAAALHPATRRAVAPSPPMQASPQRSRLAFVGLALGVPALVTAFRPRASVSDRDAISIVALLLTACAIWRVLRALRAHGQAEVRLEHQVTHDLLTGLPNRALAQSFVSRCLADTAHSAKVVGLLFLDVDRFKLVNDTLGHSTGDELLKAIASRLQHGVGSRSSLVARIGGDEFVIVLGNLDEAQDAFVIAQRIHDLIQQPFNVAGAEIFSSVSIGVACGGGRLRPGDAEGLIRDSDIAMYQAKAAGRDGVAVFSSEVRAKVADRLRIEHDLRQATAEGGLSVEYQPIISLRTGTLESFEALLRWHHPTDGLISPETFIPIAEESGLIVQIGAFVLDEACARVSEWRHHVPGAANVRVAVNASSRQLGNLDFSEAVRSTLAKYRLSPSALQLEITESVVMDSGAAASQVLGELRSMGVGISIDDFGTGYSSLAYLQRFPVDCVKIDRSFVKGLREEDSAEASLVAAIIAMCGALGMKTVAEGVEVPAQARILQDLGCDFAQGWLFSASVPPEAVPSLRWHRYLPEEVGLEGKL